MPVAIIDCVAATHILRARIQARLRAGRDASEADLSVLAAQIATQEPLTAEERAHVISSDGPPLLLKAKQLRMIRSQ